MAAEDKATIKTYFETGDTPTETQFGNLIDSYQDISEPVTALVSAVNAGTAPFVVQWTSTSAAAAVALGTFGEEWLTVAATASALDQLGAGAVGVTVLEAATTAAAQNALGLNSVPAGNFEIFTATGTFAKATLPAHVTHIIVWVLGGGGGGGGANTSTNFRGVGGAAGGLALKRIAVSSLSTTHTVTVGAGGAGGTSGASPTDGTVGGTSSFGAFCSATGGTGGTKAGGSALAGVAGGVGASGDLNLVGGASDNMSDVGGAGSKEASNGGDAPFGLGFGGRTVSLDGDGYGSGGCVGNDAGGGFKGGDGADGLVIVWW